MNKVIKDVLDERAARVEAPHMNAEQLIRSGRRRRTARRGVGAIAVAAVAAAAVAVTSTIAGWGPGDGPDAAAMNKVPDLAWADANHIYFGNDQIPRPNGYFDLTSQGERVLFTEWDDEAELGTIYEWHPGDGGGPQLVADSAITHPEVEGSMAAWIESDGLDQARLHLMVGTTDYPPLSLPTTADPPWIAALDDAGSPTVIYSTGHELWSWNGSDGPTQLDTRQDAFVDRAHGVTAVTARYTDYESTARFLDSTGREISQVHGVWADGVLDHSGSHYLTQTGTFPGTPAVIDVASGRSTPLDIGQANRALQMTWDPNGDVTVATRPRAQDKGPVDLMTCDPTAGRCTVAAENVGEFQDVILAGETYAGL